MQESTFPVDTVSSSIRELRSSFPPFSSFNICVLVSDSFVVILVYVIGISNILCLCFSERDAAFFTCKGQSIMSSIIRVYGLLFIELFVSRTLIVDNFMWFEFISKG